MLRAIKQLWLAVLLFTAGALYGANLKVVSFTGDVQFKVPGQEWASVMVDDEIPEGALIRVNGSSDKVTLGLPDGSEINLLGLTSIQVDAILKDNKNTGFKLFSGKLFAKVNKQTDQTFKVETDNAVAAVRGTEFGMDKDSGNLVVKKGSVELQDPFGKNPPVTVGPGMFSSFGPGKGFSKPRPAPQNLFTQFGQEAPANAPANDNPQGDDNKDNDSGTGGIEVPDTDVNMQGGDDTAAPTTTPADNKAPMSDECSTAGFHWSVSSENIGGAVWNKVLLSPTLKLGDVILAFYLPVYFQNLDDLGNRTTWYNGDEWNFGILPDTPFNFGDLVQDLLLKIRYAGYKSPKGNKTQVLFRVGSMPNMSLAHGLLIDNYANDTQFPAVRKVGLQFNLDLGKFGFETLIGDIFNFQMAGLHLFFRPFHGKFLIGKISFGLSYFIDYDPVGLDSGNVMGYAADMLFPIIDILGTSINLYTEAGTMGYMLPYQNQVLAKGLGVNAGVKGTILGLIDYKAEFRHLQGGFDAGYVNAFYDVTRPTKIYSLVNNSETNYNGFVIEAGKTWEKVGGLSLKFEQLFPSVPTSIAAITNAPNNYLHIELWIDKCLFKKAYGKIMYDRENFAPGQFFGKDSSGNYRFFSSAVITSQIFYQVSGDTYIGVTYKKFYDENGAVQDTYGLETSMGL